MFHGIEGYGDVVYPVCADVDEVDVVPFAELLVGFCVS